MLLLIFFELALRISGVEKTYSEKTSGNFYTYYNQHFPTWYQTHPPNSKIEWHQPEFKFTFTTNSLGLREVEFSKQRPDSMKRLVFLGDSFTEGDGVDYQYSMPRDVEHKLDSANLHFQVMNAGICGSDPLYEFVLLRDKLLQYHPTHAIVCVNNSDVIDCVIRGGMERFLSDGSSQYKKGPWWLPLYVHSHIFRLIVSLFLDNTYQTFLSESQMDAAKAKAKDEIYQSFLELKKLCVANQIKLVIIVHPIPNSFNWLPIEDDMNDLATTYPNTPINLINTFGDFSKQLNKDNYLDYSWAINGHFNNRGYQLFADILYKDINQQYPYFWK